MHTRANAPRSPHPFRGRPPALPAPAVDLISLNRTSQRSRGPFSRCLSEGEAQRAPRPGPPPPHSHPPPPPSSHSWATLGSPDVSPPSTSGPPHPRASRLTPLPSASPDPSSALLEASLREAGLGSGVCSLRGLRRGGTESWRGSGVPEKGAGPAPPTCGSTHMRGPQTQPSALRMLWGTPPTPAAEPEFCTTRARGGVSKDRLQG